MKNTSKTRAGTTEIRHIENPRDVYVLFILIEIHLQRLFTYLTKYVLPLKTSYSCSTTENNNNNYTITINDFWFVIMNSLSGKIEKAIELIIRDERNMVDPSVKQIIIISTQRE